jgi:alpha-ketoglutarate-dependent 2,4-dichlorophenoxyacetate dioxygenase
MVAAISGFKLTEISPGFGAEICGFNAADDMTEENFRRLHEIITTVLDRLAQS